MPVELFSATLGPEITAEYLIRQYLERIDLTGLLADEDLEGLVL